MEIDFPDILRRCPDGLIIELGVMAGTTFNRICDAARPRTVYGFDWFHGLPESWGDVGAGAYSCRGNLPQVRPNGRLIVGKVEDTLGSFVGAHPEPAAFVHFDLDLYRPTRHALSVLRFRPGSILAFDEIDGHSRNSDHEQRAFWEWINTGRSVRFLGRRHAASWVIQVL